MKKYTQDEKRQLVKEIDSLISQGESLRDSCKQCHTDSRTYKNFKRDLNMNTEKLNDNLQLDNHQVDDKKSCRFMISMTAADLDKLKKVATYRGLKQSTLAGSLLHVSINQLDDYK